VRSEWHKVAADARRVLEGNRQRGTSAWAGQRYDFVCPSPTTYPFQWFWDSAFHAIALLHVDPGLAKQEIVCLMQGARPDGFIPHMLVVVPAALSATAEIAPPAGAPQGKPLPPATPVQAGATNGPQGGSAHGAADLPDQRALAPPKGNAAVRDGPQIPAAGPSFDPGSSPD